ncbi:uncharacterized protein LOC143175168 [Nomia melanderi]|uniref:uncharacterized protein LOC143175168 n=1 Tax=Nomia melanderi TaxID=2448451 RepID=UPI003FCD3045
MMMMKQRLKRPSLNTLRSIASGGLVIAGFGFYNEFLYQRRLRQTKTYQRVLEILYDHEETKNHLGPPIKEGYVKFHDQRDNFKTFSFPLKGSNTKGILNCEYFLTEPDRQPVISKITFSDLSDQIFTLYKNE